MVKNLAFNWVTEDGTGFTTEGALAWMGIITVICVICLGALILIGEDE